MANSIFINNTGTGSWSQSTSATSYTLDNTSISRLYANGTAPMMVNQDGKIALRGADADIDINGVSLKQTLQAINQRLGILEVNKELEEEYQQLLELGQRYRELEAQLLEQKRVFDILKDNNIK